MFYLHKSCLKLKTFSVLGVSSFWRLKPSSVARLKIYFSVNHLGDIFM